MNQYLRSYRVTMCALGPVHVGSGREIGKKEYFFLNKGKAVGIPDMQLLYAELKKKGKAEEFERFFLGSGNMSLTQWVERQQIFNLEPLIRYRLDCGDAILEKGANRLQILGCIKDAYGMPYLPGSSLKGMLRTALLAADIEKDPGKYRQQKSALLQKSNYDASRTSYLKREIGEIEGAAFRTLQRPDSRPLDAVNDTLQGLMVSDSAPLGTGDLTLCQKIDRHTDGKEKPLPILRECIKPGTEIHFTITVDDSVCKVSDQTIWEAARLFMEGYYENFASAFAGMDRLGDDCVFCGGGCGFATKTILYPMFGKKEGIEISKRVFDKTKVPRVHKHHLDTDYGASPHTIKCTRYQGKLLQMGGCRIERIEAV